MHNLHFAKVDVDLLNSSCTYGKAKNNNNQTHKHKMGFKKEKGTSKRDKDTQNRRPKILPLLDPR